MASKSKIARPAARKSAGQHARRRATGSTKPPKTVAAKRRIHAPVVDLKVEVEPTRRRFAEPPKIQGELPTPLATFVF